MTAPAAARASAGSMGRPAARPRRRPVLVDQAVDSAVDSRPGAGDNPATSVEKLFITIKCVNSRPEALAPFWA